MEDKRIYTKWKERDLNERLFFYKTREDKVSEYKQKEIDDYYFDYVDRIFAKTNSNLTLGIRNPKIFNKDSVIDALSQIVDEESCKFILIEFDNMIDTACFMEEYYVVGQIYAIMKLIRHRGYELGVIPDSFNLIIKCQKELTKTIIQSQEWK